MEISNPRRVLAVALEGSTVHLTKVIKDLTGSHPEQTSTSLAGTTHNLSIKTSYYTAEVPIWLDLIASPEEWAESFLSDEAKEVLDVLGGIVVVFAIPPQSSSSSSSSAAAAAVLPPSVNTTSALAVEDAATEKSTPTADAAETPRESPTTSAPSAPSASISSQPPLSPPPNSADQARDLLRHVGRVVQDGLGGWSWDGVSLCVGVGEADDVDEWEELAAGCGLEFVQVKSRATGGPGRNEFGEKTGIPRVLEALESNDWAAGDLDPLGSDDDGFGDFMGQSDDDDLGIGSASAKKDTDIDPESLDFGFDREDFEGLKRAIWSSGQEIDATTTTTTTSAPPAAAAAAVGADVVVGQGGTGTADDKMDDEEVEKIERMMLKLSAVRDMAAGLPEDQRRRMAAKAVNEVMKEL
ncbi:uncharacterized protein B0I36DRAFT_110396 [Microdochium trichocladiopsis]|uniref:Alpha and gamma adaptin binding protein p34-domain-containing protein n=1 Tax=Microdochium trichocladiopsis TaxID=1682393 RepID=A0A9P8YAF3_9PEZI|nr:uncharacterized protein B0I36DRAFT_110396 [Microdochium trichocladiopsis]KAH7033556.1 hypothetical protein B0I36DRAFT_110396 [Microdochium trichocladiopsis]